MSDPRDTYLLLRAFVDELHRCGVAGACTSPGSRSTPLVLSLARDGRIPVTSHVDERSAGFFALGLAAGDRPPRGPGLHVGNGGRQLRCPAVIEAAEAGVPLIVLTADRPPELRGVGAGQTIDQIKLYGSAAKWFFEVGTHDATPARLRWIRQLACRAHAVALEGRPGPVHLNVALREPLVLDAPLDGAPGDGGRPDGAPWTARTVAPQDPAPLVAWLRRARRWPRADRRRPWRAWRRDRPPGRGAGVAAARRPAVGRAHRRRGDRPLRRAAARRRLGGDRRTLLRPARRRPADLQAAAPVAGRRWARRAAARARRRGSVAGPRRGAERGPRAGAVGAGRLIDETWPTDAAWLGRWRDADARAASAIEATIGTDEINEPRIARELATAVPAGATVVIAASMPIRDVETFWPVLDAPPRALANRGANGIDGTISTAYGVAAATGGPTYLLIGDVALAHDVGGLLAGRRLGVPLTIVVIDNAGGGIFDFLPVATQGAEYEEHVLTPTGLEVERVAALYGAGYRSVADLAGLRGRSGHTAGRHHHRPPAHRARGQRDAAPSGLGGGCRSGA